jgi:hypothetical protein
MRKLKEFIPLRRRAFVFGFGGLHLNKGKGYA